LAVILQDSNEQRGSVLTRSTTSPREKPRLS